MWLLFLSSLLFSLLAPCIRCFDILHVTDLHYDSTYIEGSDPATSCHSGGNRTGMSRAAGPFGDILCDSPGRLVLAAVDALSRFPHLSHDDLVIWTGDDVTHAMGGAGGETPALDLSAIAFCTNAIADALGSRSDNLVAAIGNHDFFPSDQAQGSMQLYKEISALWSSRGFLRTDAERADFETGGYYARTMTTSPIKVISLNTILWYLENKAVNPSAHPDPAGQFAWLEMQLSTTHAQGRYKVYVIGHVPPGWWESGGDPHLHPEYNDRLVGILARYHANGLIKGCFFGHEHSDTFRLISQPPPPPPPSAPTSTTTPLPTAALGVIFLAPAVTPWTFERTGATPPANNPGIRTYRAQFDGTVENFAQSMAVLSEANEINETRWFQEYSSVDAYNSTVENPGVGWGQALLRLAEGGNTSVAFQRYWSHYLVSMYAPGVRPCDLDCFTNNICAQAALIQAHRALCLADPLAFVKSLVQREGPSPALARKPMGAIIVGSMFAVVFVVIGAILFISSRSRISSRSFDSIGLGTPLTRSGENA